MIKSVTKENVLYNGPPYIWSRYSNMAEIIGLGSAFDFIQSLDQAVQEYEIKLSDYVNKN